MVRFKSIDWQKEAMTMIPQGFKIITDKYGDMWWVDNS